MLTEPIVCTSGGTTTFSTVEQVVTGWTKNGAGKDASFDMKLWMRFEGRFIMRNAQLSSSHTIAIGNESEGTYEAMKWSFGP